MEVLQERVANVKRGARAYCISHVYVDGVYSHDAIEDYDRGLDQSMSEAKVRSIKVPSQTAIPTGRYTVKMNRTSPKFSQASYAGGYYRKFCGGKVPCLDPVVGFAGILIHKGKNEHSSAGCVIVGYNKVVGEVTDSQSVFERMYKEFKAASDKGDKINYTITRKYKA